MVIVKEQAKMAKAYSHSLRVKLDALEIKKTQLVELMSAGHDDTFKTLMKELRYTQIAVSRIKGQLLPFDKFDKKKKDDECPDCHGEGHVGSTSEYDRMNCVCKKCSGRGFLVE